MSLVFDAALVAALARELDERLAGARLRALRLDRGDRSLALLFREGTLRLGLHPDAGSVGWHDPVEPGPADRPLSARLKRVAALPDDRVLRFSFLRVRGSPQAVDIIVEWITKRWNAIVTEGPDGVVRHVLSEMEGERAARTGHPWVPPTASTRAGITDPLDAERWRALLGGEGSPGRRRALLDGVAWTSALNAEALLAGGWPLWSELAGVARGERPSAPVIIAGTSGPQPYPLPLGDRPTEPAASLLEAFTRAAEAQGARSPTVPGALLDALQGRAVRAWARGESLARELADAPDPAGVRATGDLILARIADVPRGVDRATLVDFDGGPIHVELDPQLAPHENASAYYERAARAERARARLPALIAAAEAEARRLDALLERARAGAESVEAIRAELPAGAQESAAGDPAPSLPYRSYQSSGGLEIRVGRGARHNDDLTFHHSAPEDVWLHARHAAGAHVVLRWKGEGNPPARDLAEAAVLAALHSKARTSGSVPVDWTRRKHVRKPRRSPPGAVLVDRAKTLFVAPDPALEERLRVE